MTYRITLVIDESCGSQLDELVRTSYVWAIQSPENDRWAAQHWQASSPLSDPLQFGLTTFARLPAETDTELVIRLLEMIDDHHGEFSHEPAWSQIDVLGTHLTDEIADAARCYGVERFDETPEGFRLVRGLNLPAHDKSMR